MTNIRWKQIKMWESKPKVHHNKVDVRDESKLMSTGPRLPATAKLHVLEWTLYSYLCLAGAAVPSSISEQTSGAPGSSRQPKEGSLQKENTAFTSTEKQSFIITQEDQHGEHDPRASVSFWESPSVRDDTRILTSVFGLMKSWIFIVTGLDPASLED